MGDECRPPAPPHPKRERYARRQEDEADDGGAVNRGDGARLETEPAREDEEAHQRRVPGHRGAEGKAVRPRRERQHGPQRVPGQSLGGRSGGREPPPSP